MFGSGSDSGWVRDPPRRVFTAATVKDALKANHGQQFLLLTPLYVRFYQLIGHLPCFCDFESSLLLEPFLNLYSLIRHECERE